MMEMRAVAKGDRKDASTPVKVNGKGPSSFKHVQPHSDFTSRGTDAAGKRRESSSAVGVIENRGSSRAQAGMGASEGKRQTANPPGIREKRKASPAIKLS